LQSEYTKRGFSEVITPNMYNTKLWERSGHWQNYQENMFSFEVENEKFALKPMNCPGHCLMFGLRTRFDPFPSFDPPPSFLSSFLFICLFI